MLLTKCSNPSEIIPYLKLDYANNLYFFTYINEYSNNPAINFLTVNYHGKIDLVLLITPIHCCIYTSNIETIHAIADQLPPINSIHMVGSKDLHESLLNISKGPERIKHIYLLSEYTPKSTVSSSNSQIRKASITDLSDLIDFYNNNDMLIDAENRLPGIISWGKVFMVRRDNKIVSCALTTTETNEMAMIGSVYTIPAYRNNGYAKDCIVNLCKDLMRQNKKAYLFYQSDSALLGSFYESLGFRPINTWILASYLNVCLKNINSHPPKF